MFLVILLGKTKECLIVCLPLLEEKELKNFMNCGISPNLNGDV